MQTYRLLFVSFLLLFWIKATGQDDTKNVLFIGNSITYFNDMPQTFREIANNKGKSVTVSMYAPGGTGIVNHFQDPNVFALLRENVWDYIILQPGSGESPGVSYPVDTTVSRGKIILDSVYQYSPCAKVYLYEIPYGVQNQNAYNNYFAVQTMIKDSVTKMTDSLHLQMVPAGECARAYYEMNQNLLLHSSYNDIHPNSYGSYLVAATMYATIFQDSVSGCSYFNGLEPDTLHHFFDIVDDIVLNHLANWRINTYNLHAGFSYQTDGTTVSFFNESSNFSTSNWNFGDGNQSTTLHPQHNFSISGNYEIMLTVNTSNSCSETSSQIITINENAGIKNSDLIHLQVYPNPFDNFIQITTTTKNCNYKIINNKGQLLLSGNLSPETCVINLGNLPKGNYWIHFTNEKGETVSSQQIQKIESL